MEVVAEFEVVGLEGRWEEGSVRGCDKNWGCILLSPMKGVEEDPLPEGAWPWKASNEGVCSRCPWGVLKSPPDSGTVTLACSRRALSWFRWTEFASNFTSIDPIHGSLHVSKSLLCHAVWPAESAEHEGATRGSGNPSDRRVVLDTHGPCSRCVSTLIGLLTLSLSHNTDQFAATESANPRPASVLQPVLLFASAFVKWNRLPLLLICAVAAASCS